MAGDSFAAVLLILVTLFGKEKNSNLPKTASIERSSANFFVGIHLVPPVGVFMIGGCCPDLFVNICLTLLG